MPETRRLLLHSDHEIAGGVALSPLWGDHKPLKDVLALKSETPIQIWEGTYQGNPTPPAGSIFKRSWWDGKNRFDANDSALTNQTIARYISWDTGLKDNEDNAFTAAIVGDLFPDYRLAVRFVYRERLEFPYLPNQIDSIARRFNRDGKLRAVIIEDRASGTSAYQTLRADRNYPADLIPFSPTVDKETRANQAAVWCANDCIFLPIPDPSVPWLYDFEDELFNFPGTTYKDQTDAFSQLILYAENILATGHRARQGIPAHV